MVRADGSKPKVTASWSRLALAGALMLTVAAPGAAQQEAMEAVERGGGGGAAERDALLLAGLSGGLDVRALAAEVARERDGAPRGTILPPASRAASEISGALRRLETLVGQPASARALASAFEDFTAQDLLLRRELERTGETLTRLGIGGEVAARHAEAVATYTRLSDLLHAAFDQPVGELRRLERSAAASEASSTLRRAAADVERAAPAVRAALAEIPRAEPLVAPLRAANLPYRRASLAARPPRLTPVITPSYLDPAAAEPGIAELTADGQTPFSQAILSKADELGHDPARIYEFVRNGIATELYAGAMKGAEATLEQASGNDVDQASLLIALLRASQVPARYVHGVLELSLESIAGDLGVADAAAVPGLLGRLGLAFRPVVRGGRVVAVEIEQTWVAAYVPYSNYRGAVVDFSGKSWVPLAPALKHFHVEPSTAVLRSMGDDVDARIDAYLGTVQLQDLLTELRQDVEAYLQGGTVGAPHADQLGRRSIVAETFRLLPSSLPVPVVAVTAESNSLAGPEIERVRLIVRAGAGEGSPVALETELPLSELSSQRVTLSYTPATVEDHRAVNAWGGFYAVPLYLVQVRPQIKIAGRLAAMGTGALDMGASHRFELELVGPTGSQRISQTVVAGAYHALALSAQAARGPLEDGEDPGDSERQAARLLSQLAHEYSEQWDAAENELGGLLDVAVLRPLPAVVVASNSVAVETLLGLPYSFRWKGVTLDAALRAAEPVARSADAAAARDWMRLSALEGSSLEQTIFRAQFQVDAVSADKGLAIARAAGIEIVTLTSANIAAELPGLAHPPAVKTELDNWVRQGLTVEIPRTVIQRNAWSGSVWRVEETATGAAGYFIAGALAGGASSEPPESWVLDFLARALASPYSSEPNSDPLSVATLRKIPAGDFQEGIVGEEYDNTLAVLARDGDGRPVVGAPVTFVISEGGGELSGGGAGAGTSVTVATDSLGIAQVRLRAGERTSVHPVYTLRHAGDRWATQVLGQIIDAAAESADGVVLPEAPFEALAYPGPLDHLSRLTPEGNFIGREGLGAGLLGVQPRDEFENPLSNVEVTFSVGPPTFLCDPTEMGNFRNGAVYTDESCPDPAPRLDTCGSPSVRLESAVNGAAAGMILGNATGTIYHFQASVGGLPPIEEEVREFHECNDTPNFSVTTTAFRDFDGRNVQAVRAGERFERPIPIRLQYEWPDYEIRVDDEGKCYVHHLPTREWRTTTGTFEFLFLEGGSASPPVFNGEFYETFVTTGPLPARNQAEMHVGHAPTEQPAVNRDTCEEYIYRTEGARTTFLDAVYGLEPKIEAISPPEIQLTESGQSAEPVTLQYSIAPAEYRAITAEVNLYEEDTLIGRIVGSSREVVGTANLQRGLRFDLTKTYEAEVITSRGLPVEVLSERFRLPLVQSIFTHTSRSVTLSQDVDVLNERVCSIADAFHFGTTQEATITLAFRKIESYNVGGTPNLGSEVRLIDGQVFPAGEHSHLVTPQDLLPGDYLFEIRGVSTVDGHEEIFSGSATSQFLTHDSLPVGHAMYKGVDLFDGHLSIVREDFALTGRGVPLRFVRSYSSNGDKKPGALGVGWSHNYESRVVIDKCGEAIVIGGEGGGMRFVDDGQGGLRPLKGFHGTLKANAADNSFDFYSKDGTRSHYVFAGPREWLLDFLEDANGNKTTLTYDRTGAKPKVASVADSSGRSLTFTWTRRIFNLFVADVITKLEGPGNVEINFEYNDQGNLVRAAREGGVRADVYGYPDPTTALFETRALITEVRDDVSGATTQYAYDKIPIGVQGAIKVPSHVVVSMTEPEGGSTTFTYDTAALDSRDPIVLNSSVRDRRGGNWGYQLNKYGSPLAITDPAGNTVSMTWAADDVVMTSRTDGNGARIEYEYDEHGNVIREQLTVHDYDGTAHSTPIEQTWHPPTAFANQATKDRLASRTDRNGVRTEYTYDGRGNLIRMTVVGQGHTESYAVAGNGDRLTLVDANGRTRSFSYDAYGNVSAETDPLGGITAQVWDVRGRQISKTDAEGRTTTFTYDALSRLTGTSFPGGGQETVTFNDAGHEIVTTDALGNSTTKVHDREMRLLRTVDALGNTKAMSYDPEGGVVGESNWFGGLTPRADTTISLDALGRPSTRTEPEGRTTTYVYDGVGNVVRETLNGPGLTTPQVTERGFDELNREHTFRRRLETGEITLRRRFDGQGNLIEEVNPLGFVSTRTYDGLGRVLTHRDPLGGVTTNTYDALGNQLSETDPIGRVRRKEYDSLRRVTRKLDALNQATLYEYDRVGNVVREVDRRLHETRYEYDQRDRLVRTELVVSLGTAPAGTVRTTHGYDLAGNRISTTYPNGRIETVTYDELHRVLSVRDQLGTVSTRGYDANGNVVRETDANGNVMTREFDGLNRLVTERAPEGRTVHFTYDAAGNRITQTDARGNVARFDYDAANRLVKTSDAASLGTFATTTYDLAGKPILERDRNGNETRFRRDALGRVLAVTDPPSLGTTMAYTYDGVGNLTSETDRRGIVSTNTYDLENRRLATTRAGVTTRRYEYDPNGNLRFEVDANNNITGYEYDERNLRVAVNKPLAAITRYRLDAMGDRLEERDPENRVMLAAYDLRRRKTSETDPAGNVTRYTYDDNGNLLTVQRPSGATWTRVYDGANRLVSITDPLSQVTAYTYDAGDNRETMTDGRGKTTRAEFDALNRQTATVFADGSRIEMGRDGNGNVVSRQDAKGQSATYGYDALNRETGASFSQPTPPTGDDLVSRTQAYDRNGNLVTVSEVYNGGSGTRTTTYAYDDFERVIAATDPNGEIVRYSYDAAGNRIQLRDSDGRLTTYAYDALNRATTVNVPLSGVTQYSYLRNSLLSRVVYPNGTEARTTYDTANRVQRIDNLQNSATVSSYSYTYDANSNRAQQIEVNGGAAESTTYTYDVLDRLTGVVYPDKTAAYTYDAASNRLTETETNTGGTTLVDRSYTYDDRNRLLSVTDALDAAQSISYTYDANGNQIARAQNGVSTSFAYDASDRLVEVQRGGLLLGRYLYNHEDLRVRKAGGGTIRRYIYDDQNVLQTTDDAGNTILRFEYGPDRLLSMVHATEGRQFYLFDGLRSIVDLTRPDGAVQVRYRYDAWGNLRSTLGTSFNLFGFTGYERDDESGLHYAKARYYDSTLGRFLSLDRAPVDPVDPFTLNGYAYSRVNPTRFVDPSGLYAEDGHYYTTYYVALKVGYSPKQARVLAFYSQAPDEVRDFDAIEVAVNHASDVVRNLSAAYAQGQAGGPVPGLDIDYRRQQESEKQRNFVQRVLHALTGNPSGPETESTAQSVKDAKGDLRQMGILTHRLADTFAHRRAGWGAVFGITSDDLDQNLYDTGHGHLFGGHTPDLIQRRPELYLRYVEKLAETYAAARGITDPAEIKRLKEETRQELRDIAELPTTKPKYVQTRAGRVRTQVSLSDEEIEEKSVSALRGKLEREDFSRRQRGEEGLDLSYRPEENHHPGTIREAVDAATSKGARPVDGISETDVRAGFERVYNGAGVKLSGGMKARPIILEENNDGGVRARKENKRPTPPAPVPAPTDEEASPFQGFP